MKLRLARGFTLVELLIVIALLGIIATIVIAAINPIEQANRAQDAGSKADASQIVSAIDRYYASHSIFPWNAASCTPALSGFCDSGAAASPDDSFATTGKLVSADDAAVGICGATGLACKSSAASGELVTSLELQKTFLNKGWVGATAGNQLLVGKAQGASSAVYVCWVPKANSNRQVLIANPTRMFDLTGNLTASGLPAPALPANCATVTSGGWKTGQCGECVPE